MGSRGVDFELTNEQKRVEDEKVADGKGREARVAVAEDDHDHPGGAEVGLITSHQSQRRRPRKIPLILTSKLTEYGWNQPLYGRVFLSRPCALHARKKKMYVTLMTR